MAIKMGKLMTQVVCPMCNTVWLLENNEWSYDSPKDKDSLAAHFYCYECEREVKFNTDKTIPIISNFPLGPVLYLDTLFYENEEIEEFYKKQEEDE